MKNQLKKSLSVLMAVLMILSCWVWVAPEQEVNKASAADGTNAYSFEFGVGHSAYTKSNNVTITCKVWYLSKNGTGTFTGPITQSHTSSAGDLSSGFSFTGLDGFPAYAEVSCSGVSSDSDESGYTEVASVQVNGSENKWNDSWTIENNTLILKLIPFSQTPSGTSSGTTVDLDFDAPKIAGFRDYSITGTSTGATFTAFSNTTATSTNNSNSFDISNAKYVDQYGVNWTADTKPANFSALSAMLNETTAYISESDGGSEYPDPNNVLSCNTSSITADASMQHLMPSEEGKQQYYLIKTFEATHADGSTKLTSKISIPHTINYSKVTTTFDARISGTTVNIYDSEEGGNKLGSNGLYTPQNYYGNPYTPPVRAVANGYTFKGFWSNKQPTAAETVNGTTYDASYNASEAAFAEPKSTEEFKALGGNETDKYVTKDGKTYYNAGVKYDPATMNTISGENKYYGWWIAKDLSVKFYDIDGKFLASYSIKNGQSQSAISPQWPSSLYKKYPSGAITYTIVDNMWVGLDGEEVNAASYTFTHDLILTPKYTVDEADIKKDYEVNFVDPGSQSGNLGVASRRYGYRENIAMDEEVQAVIGTRPVPTAIANGLDYSYEFIGWTTVENPINGRYHIVQEDRDFDENGTAISINSDWIVRNDVTYYAVYRRSVKSYVVRFTYIDSTGNRVSYEDSFSYNESIVPPTAYVPYTYAKAGYGFTFKEWKYTNKSTNDSALAYDGSLILNTANIRLQANALDDDDNVVPLQFTATYSNPVPTPYNVVFKYKDTIAGETIDVYKTLEVSHGEEIKPEDFAAIAPVESYDNGTHQISFMNRWTVVEGAAVNTSNSQTIEKGATLESEVFATLSPTSHITFEAVYGNEKPFYTVKYVDSASGKEYTERLLVGENLPYWTQTVKAEDGTETEEFYIPTMAENERGSYQFLGWYDVPQSDKDFLAPNGNKILDPKPAEDTEPIIVNGNITLYAQFRFVAHTYTIEFMNFDGTEVLETGEFEYGDRIKPSEDDDENAELTIYEKATAKAQVRDADEVYSYVFLGWDKVVPEKCEGSDITFIPVYKSVYVHYQAKWYNSVRTGDTWDDSTWAADKSAEALATTNHTYGSKVNAPSVVTAYSGTDVPANKHAVFAGWYYIDKDGNEAKYTRGMIITGNMEFYAKYALESNVYTVTTNVNGVTAKYQVAANATVNSAGIPNPADKYVDATNHNTFEAWYTDAACTADNKCDMDAPITADITLYAKFTLVEHSIKKEVVSAPTYYATGSTKSWCACDPTQTETTAEIAMLTDTVAPTGTIQLGTLGTWKSTDENPVINDETVQFYVNAGTDVIVSINDKGDISEYNPAGIGKGIQMLGGFAMPADQAVVGGEVNADVAQAAAVYVYNDASKNQNNTANAVVELGKLYTVDLDEEGNVTSDRKPLESGKEYVIYYFAVDKAGNVLREKVRTKNFIYDTTAPEVTLTGSHKETTGIPSYCEAVTISGVEAGAKVAVDGKEVTLADGKYVISLADDKAASNHIITVTDRAGNTTTKKIKLVQHDYTTIEVDATCTQDGYTKTECLNCGDKTVTTDTSDGHSYSRTTVAATCTENGYYLDKCSACGDEVKTFKNENDEYIFPANGHLYEAIEGTDPVTADSNNIKYTVVKEPTCTKAGLSQAKCLNCDDATLKAYPSYAEGEIPDAAHDWSAMKTLKPTCTDKGMTYQVCYRCHASKKLSDIDALGHDTDSGNNWIVTTYATCKTEGVETLTCTRCAAAVDTRAIAATGKHIRVSEEIKNDEGKVTAIRYTCSVCGEVLETVTVETELPTFTVKFDVDGEENDVVIIKKQGETIAKTDAPATTPTKASTTTVKYTFAGWADADGKKVALPFEVQANITLTPIFSESTRIYTHQFFVPNTWIQPLAEQGYETDPFATIIGDYGSTNKKPATEPVFRHFNEDEDAALKEIYTITFDYWADEEGNKVTDFTMTEDKSFYAVFKSSAIKYSVTYLDGTEYVWNTTVEGGQAAVFGGTEPTKAYDGTYHYAFEGWYTDVSCTAKYNGAGITADTKLYAKYTATAHTYDIKGEVTVKADCLKDEMTQYACSCDATTELKTADKLGHEPLAAQIVVIDKVSYSIVYCGRCNEELSKTKTSVEIVFKNWNGVRLATDHYNVVADGEEKTYIRYTAATPTKAADAANSYVFAGWYIENDENETLVATVDADGYIITDGAKVEATADTVYVAKFNTIASTFRVTYVDKDNNVLQTTDGIAYEGEVPAFTGTVPANEEYTIKKHYVFKQWSVAAGTKVTSDIVITPVYDAVDHDLVSKNSDPTCTVAGGTSYTCKGCDYSYLVDATVPATGHKWDNGKVTAEPDNNAGINGTKLYTCTVCKATKEEVIKAESSKITVRVVDTNGNVLPGTTVRILDSNKFIVQEKVADANGEVSFVGPKDTYYYTVIYNGEVVIKEHKANDGLNVTPGIQTEPQCGCACHNDGFWGVMYRLIQKIIKLFTGKISCCECPDGRY